MQKLKSTICVLLVAIASMATAMAQQLQTNVKVSSHSKFILNNTLDKNESADFKPQIIISTIDSEIDAWHKMPKNAIPVLTSIKTVRYNEKFTLFPIIRNASVKDGKFNVKYTITATAPDGQNLTIVEKASFVGSKKETHNVIICPDIIDIKLDNQYQKGKYTFTISALDEHAKINVSTSEQIEIIDWKAPKPIDDKNMLNQAFVSFHLKPSADLLYAMFFSKELDFQKNNAPYNLDFTILGFFKAAFLHYDFLIDEIRNNFEKYKPDERAKIILLMRILGKKPFDEKILNNREIKYQRNLQKANIPNPYENWDRVLAAAQIDMLWGEFYANGTYKPLRRVMNLLINEKEAKIAQEMIAQKRRPKTEKEINQFTMGVLHILAVRTIIKSADACDRIDQYCVWAIENKDLPDESMQVIEPILGNTKK